MDGLYDEISKIKYYLMYQKEHQLGGLATVILKIKENQHNLVFHH